MVAVNEGTGKAPSFTGRNKHIFFFGKWNCWAISQVLKTRSVRKTLQVLWGQIALGGTGVGQKTMGFSIEALSVSHCLG